MRGRILLAAFLLLVPGVAAHASLLSSTPANGERLDASPSQVVVTLSEGIEPTATTLQVTATDGRDVTSGPLSITTGDTPVLARPLLPNLPSGVYRVAWKVLSQDTHTVTGSIAFAVGSAAAPLATTDAAPPLHVESALGRFLVYAGYTLAFGAALFLVWVNRGGEGRLAAKAVVVATVAHGVGMGLLLHFTASDSGQGLSALLLTGVGKNLYLRFVLGVAALLLATIAFRRSSRVGVMMAILVLLGCASANAAYSHAFKDGLVAIAADFLHILSTSTWVGGLLLLAAHLKEAGNASEAEARRVGLRFGQAALMLVIVLAATGTLLVFFLLGDRALHFDAWMRSDWGSFLLAKVMLAGLMVALAAINRYVLLEAPATRGIAGRLQRFMAKLSNGNVRPLQTTGEPFRNAVRIEAFFGIAILVLAGFLTSVSPPAAEAASSPDLVRLRAQGDYYVVHATLIPTPTNGSSSIVELVIEDAATGLPIAGETCGRSSCIQPIFTFTGIEESNRPAALAHGNGTWIVHGVLWPRSGDATLNVTISTAEHFLDTVTMPFKVR